MVDARSLDSWEFTLNADPAAQQLLLELVDHDTRLAQLAHRLRTLPEAARQAELEQRAAQVRDQLVAAETIAADFRRDLERAEADVAQVREREERDRELLQSGSIGDPRQLQSIQSELESLARRKSTLEDAELEVMERLEGAEAAVVQLTGDREAVAAELAEATQAASDARSALEQERAAVERQREAASAKVPAELLALYVKAGADHGGIGAAHLHRGRCEGCMLTLTPTELESIKAARPDEVVRCEECRRILVRTSESGLG